MAEQVAQRFMDALRRLERERNVEPVVALFADDAEANSLGRKHPARGRAEIRRFWSEYLAQFDRITSEFTDVIASERGATLEWLSRGRLRGGDDVVYRGVSIVEVHDDRIIRFRTYFDTAVFMPHGAKLAASH